MTRRTEWQVSPEAVEDGGGLGLSRAGGRPPPAPATPEAGPESGALRRESDPVERARAICLRLLSGTPRTRKQLADALRQRDIPEDAAHELLARFEDVGLIDDAAFAAAWVESRHRGRGLSGGALARELRAKGVAPEVIADAVETLEPEQEELTARKLVDRKLMASRGVEPTKRMRRLVGMLARKGYPQGLALRVVRQALEEEGEQAEFLERHLPDT